MTSKLNIKSSWIPTLGRMGVFVDVLREIRFLVGSSSALLDRVKMFLPQMEKVRVRYSRCTGLYAS